MIIKVINVLANNSDAMERNKMNYRSVPPPFTTIFHGTQTEPGNHYLCPLQELFFNSTVIFLFDLICQHFPSFESLYIKPK